MKILQLFLVIWLAHSSSALNPECQPRKSANHYEEALLVYVDNPTADIREKVQYIMKHFACATPIDDNIHTYILNYTGGSLSENLERRHFYNSEVFAEKLEGLYVNGISRMPGDTCYLIRKFLEQKIVKTYKNVKFINGAECSDSDLQESLIPLDVRKYRIENSDEFVFVHSKGSALIKVDAKKAPKFLVEASKAIIKETLIAHPPGFIYIHKSSLITAGIGFGINLAALIFLGLLTGKVLKARKSFEGPASKIKKSSFFSRSRGSKTPEDRSKTPENRSKTPEARSKPPEKEAPKKKLKAKCGK